MTIRLPPLNALRAFEVAARHLSFKQAAAELHVSPTAISHQIRTLEDYLGLKLFHRLNRSLELTAEARASLPSLSDGFARLAQAVAILRKADNAPMLSISAAPAFVTKWLMPRLQKFVAEYPTIEIRIAATMQAVDRMHHDAEPLDRSEGDMTKPDVEIRFGSGEYGGYDVEKLLSVRVTPLCSPALLNGEHALQTPNDLRHHTLLHDDALQTQDQQAHWGTWLRHAGAHGVDASRGPHFSHAALTLDAAADGLGVALAMDVLATLDMRAGRLVAPFAISLPLTGAYYLVCDRGRRQETAIKAFRDWLLKEAAADGRTDTSQRARRGIGQIAASSRTVA